MHLALNNSTFSRPVGLEAPPARPILDENLTIRPAVISDEPFIDHCQKLFKGHLGFLYSGTIARKIDRGEVLVAIDGVGAWHGYVMGTTAYDKNDAVSRVDQIAVVPARQRRQLGGALLSAWIDKLPYGVTLICCWCAQDLREGRFWEAQGFIPLAFRAGGQTQGRVHIFWQRRTRTGDRTTSFWYPKESANGAMSAARLILPIPIGADWREIDLPRVLPQGEGSEQLLPATGPMTPAMITARGTARQRALPGQTAARKTLSPAEYQAKLREKMHSQRSKAPTTAAIVGQHENAPAAQQAAIKQAPKPRVRNTPEHVAAAREIRDRWLEELNEMDIAEGGSFDPSRNIDAAPTAMGTLASRIMGRLTEAEGAD